MTSPTPATPDTSAQALVRNLAAAAESAERLLRTVQRMRPGQVVEPSALPGWTRGHILAHIARNADALGNLLRGARTSQPIPMYPSPESRDRGIQDGAKRPLAEQLADLRASGLRFTAATEAMPDAAWAVEVPHRTGPFPASGVPLKRIAEVEYHHVDLGLDYTPAHWPAAFVAQQLADLTERFRGSADLPSMVLQTLDTSTVLSTGRPVPADRRQVEFHISGAAHDLLAWLAGRSDGGALAVTVGCFEAPDPRAALPAIPPLG